MGVAASYSRLPVSEPEPETETTRARNLPPEIIEEILLRLPVKSLLRFSTVSKAWQATVSDREFVQRHKRSCRGRAGAAIVAIIPKSLGGRRASTRPLSSINPDMTISDADGEPFSCPFGGESSGTFESGILASCGDLWCVGVGSWLRLWNPSTRTFRNLPKPSFTAQHDQVLFGSDFCFGVGYDSVGDDYKVLKFLGFGEYGGEVYSLRGDTWKPTAVFPGKVKRRGGGVAAGGALHWLARAHSGDWGVVIVSFDLSAETYAEVAMPPANLSSDDAELSVSRGKLCVALRHDNGRVGIYSMATQESWAKIYEIGFAPSTAVLSHNYESGLIGVVTRDAAHNIRPYTLICADEKRVFHCVDGFSCHLYVESLVSPETYGGGRPELSLGGTILLAVMFVLSVTVFIFGVLCIFVDVVVILV